MKSSSISSTGRTSFSPCGGRCHPLQGREHHRRPGVRAVAGLSLHNLDPDFGPPNRVVMDQQMSLMGHETAAEFERLGMTRCPRGTTHGHGAQQHTGTGLVERHTQLMKLTMFKLRAELQRQGISHEPQELCQESCVAHNVTLNYGGATPCMSVFGILPRGFYDPEKRWSVELHWLGGDGRDPV